MRNLLLLLEFNIINQPMILPNFKVRPDTKFFLGALTVLWIVYATLTIFAPTAEAVSRYGLTLSQAQLLRVSIVLPYLFIWVTAMLSVVWFRRYTNLLEGSVEQDSFRKLTKGLWMLLGVIVIPSFVITISNYFPGNLDVQKIAMIVRNYITVAMYMLGFWYFWQASKGLLKSVNIQVLNSRYESWIMVCMATLATVYSWAVFNNEFRTVSTDPLVKATYYLPDYLIISTIIIPYLIVWAMGARTVFNIWSYTKQVSGIIYKKIFSALATGLTVTITLLIALQFLSQASGALGHSALRVILIIVYIILFAIALGYFLIARGARKLAAIEEVK